jgi:DNA-binding helix-hairpin-helix protein with protein kinase domain
VRTWIAALGEEVVLHEVDLPACCQRSARDSDHFFECPSCGAVWQAPLPVVPEEDAFGHRDAEERKGAA